MKSLEQRILLSKDREEILNWASARLAQTTQLSGIELEMKKWNARWRGEALDHYLPTGWCFQALANNQIEGFVLAQPMLFTRGHTQSVWVEEVIYTSLDVGQSLLQTVHKWARDKHIQCVWMENRPELKELLHPWAEVAAQDGHVVEIKSARYV